MPLHLVIFLFLWWENKGQIDIPRAVDKEEGNLMENRFHGVRGTRSPISISHPPPNPFFPLSLLSGHQFWFSNASLGISLLFPSSHSISLMVCQLLPWLLGGVQARLICMTITLVPTYFQLVASSPSETPFLFNFPIFFFFVRACNGWRIISKCLTWNMQIFIIFSPLLWLKGGLSVHWGCVMLGRGGWIKKQWIL